MNKILFVAIAALFSSALYAQEMTVNAGKTTFGLRAGVNFQTINGKNANDDKLENKLLTGFHGGLNAEIPVGSGFYVQPGLLYTMKGAKLENSDTKVKLSYIDIPVNFVYKPILGTGNMLLGFGPYLGIGIGGKMDNGNNEMDIEFSNDPVNTLSYTQFKKLDAGANLLAGYEFHNKLSFQLNAQLGLVNINPEVVTASNDKTNWRNTGWGISLGYRF